MRHISAGKGKGKSKKSLSVPQNEASKQPQRQSKRFASYAKKSVSIKYFNAKINFTLRNVDDCLAKMLRNVFTNQPQLQNYSILRLLKLPHKHEPEQVFEHQIDTKQALTLLYHLQSIKNGEVDQLRQIAELIDIIQHYQLEENQIGTNQRKKYDEKRIRFNNEVCECRKALKTVYQNKINQIQSQFDQSYDFFRLDFLYSKAQQLSMKLFDETVVGLRQFQVNKKTQVEVIFEHPYPSKVYSPYFLKKRIGPALYLKKKMSFLSLYAYTQRQGINNSNLIVCHVCKSLVRSEYIRCAERDKKIIEQTHLNSPNIYYKRMIAVDYRYDPKDAVDLNQQLDYYKYSCNPNNRKQCNRVYCIDCIPKLSKVAVKDYLMNYKCDFCSQICNCQSCLTAYQLVRTLAYFKEILVKNFQNLQPYQKLFDRVNFLEKTDPIFKTNFECRTGFNQAGNQDFKQTYQTTMIKYQKLVQKINQIQDLTILSKQQLTNSSIPLTPQMKEVKFMFQQFKKLKNFKQAQGKTLENQKNYYLQMQNKKSQRLAIQKLTQSEIQPLRVTFDKQPQAHNVFRKFSVSTRQAKEIPSQTLTKQEHSKLASSVLQRFSAVKASDLTHLVRMKADVAYTEQDYDRMVVPEKYKMYSQREKTIQHLSKKGIFHQIAEGNTFSPVYCNFQHYFENINDYFLLNKSNEQTQEDINFIIESSQGEVDQGCQLKVENTFKSIFSRKNTFQNEKRKPMPQNLFQNESLLRHQGLKNVKTESKIQPFAFGRMQIHNNKLSDQESDSAIQQISQSQFKSLKKNSK